MATHYPDTFKGLLKTCNDYRCSSVDLDGLKAAVWNAAQTVVAAEEKIYRDTLQKAEGELDMIQFTFDQARVFDETLAVVEAIEAMALDALADAGEQTRSWESH